MRNRGLRQGLAFCPDIMQACARGPLQPAQRRSRGVSQRVVDARKGLRVLHVRAAIGVGCCGDQDAAVFLLHDAAGGQRVFSLGIARAGADARRVDDRNLADAVLRGVNAIDDQLVLAGIADIDVRVSVRHPDLAAAGAEDLAGQDNLASLRREIVNNDRLLRGIKRRLHWHGLTAEVHARHGVPAGVDQVTGRRGHKRIVDVERYVLRPALDQAVDVEEARGDGDRALREDACTGRVDGRIEADVDGPAGDRRECRTGGRLSYNVGSVRKTVLVKSAIRSEYNTAQGVEIDKLPRVFAGVEPVVAVEGKVLGGVDLDRVAAHLP